MTFARAGHCPLIHVPANQPAGMRKARLLVPDGLVVGLQIDDGTMFESILKSRRLLSHLATWWCGSPTAFPRP
jgi:hypothetical protein